MGEELSYCRRFLEDNILFKKQILKLSDQLYCPSDESECHINFMNIYKLYGLNKPPLTTILDTLTLDGEMPHYVWKAFNESFLKYQLNLITPDENQQHLENQIANYLSEKATKLFGIDHILALTDELDEIWSKMMQNFASTNL